MSKLRISDAPLLPDVDGTEKIPTGGRGDYTISVDQIKGHIFQDIGKELVGLGNVDNTSDLDKPVSTAQQAALNLKANKTYVDTNLNLKADKTNIYTRSETTLALSKKADLVNGVVPENQIPSSFNDVLEFTTPNLPIIGESGKIYVTTDNNKTWRWGGNKYVEISGWNPDSVSKSVTLPTYYTKESGVDLVTGVPDGAYFNVRSSSDESYADEYQNIGGVPTPSGKSYPSGAALDGVIETVETVDAKLKRENVSLWDFFTAEEYATYTAAPTAFDAYRPVQEFFDYISANDVGVAYCSGTVYVSSGIIFGGASGSKTKQVIGEFHLCALGASEIHTLFLLQTGQELKWLGLIEVRGNGGIFYANRKVRRGLVLGGQYACTHTYINGINANNGFIEYGVLIDNLTTGYNLDNIRVTRCGSGFDYTANGASLYSNFTLQSEVISAGTSQSSTLSVTTLPPTGLAVNPMIEIDNEVYSVNSIDYANSTITVFPLIKRNINTGSLKWVFGAGVASVGGDASVGRIGKINATANGIVYYPSALYPAVVGAITSETNFATLAMGSSNSAALVGGSIDSFYTENNKFEIIRRTAYALNFHILTNVAFNFDKFYDMTGPRSPITGLRNASNVGSNGIVIGYGGQNVSWENGAGATNISKQVDVTDPVRTELFFYANTRPITIAVPNLGLNNATGLNRKPVVVVGTGDNGNPTGDIIFNAPAGYTVNGAASVTFNGFTQAAKFDVYLQFSRNNFVVVCTTLEKKIASSSVTYDPPSLNAAGTGGDSVTTTVTLTGATVGSVVQAAFNQYNADIEISATVSSANTVTVKFKNTSAAPIDLPSGTLTVKLI